MPSLVRLPSVIEVEDGDAAPDSAPKGDSTPKGAAPPPALTIDVPPSPSQSSPAGPPMTPRTSLTPLVSQRLANPRSSKGSVSFGGTDPSSPKYSRKRVSTIASAPVRPSATSFDAKHIQNIIAEWPLFRKCSPSFMQSLSNKTKVETYSAGQEVARKGTPGSCLVFVLKGLLKVFIGNTNVGLVTAGGHFGETLLLGIEQHWSVTMFAEVYCVLGQISHDDLFICTRPFPETTEHFESILTMGTSSYMASLRDNCELFNGLSKDTLQALEQEMVIRVHCPGEQILTEGDPSDELYILVRGEVHVQIAGRMVRDLCQTGDSSSGNIYFGELGLLGLQKVRTATVIARTTCIVKVLYRAVFLFQLTEHKDSLSLKQVEEFLEARYDDRQKVQVKQTIEDIHIFREVGCSEPFLDFLAENLEDRMFLDGQVIVHEDSTDRCMYIIRHGSVKVMKEGSQVATMGAGGVFGEMALLGLAEKRTATIIAMSICYAEVLHQSVVARGMEMFPDERDKVLAVVCKRMGTLATQNGQTPQTRVASNRALINEIAKAPFFKSMDPLFVEEISSMSTDRIFLPGELITEEGRRGDSMFVMVSGEAAVYVSDEDNHMSGQANIHSLDRHPHSTLHSPSPTPGGRHSSFSAHEDADRRPSAAAHAPPRPRSSNLHDPGSSLGGGRLLESPGGRHRQPPRTPTMAEGGLRTLHSPIPEERQCLTPEAPMGAVPSFGNDRRLDKRAVKKIGALGAGCLFGELTMLGVSTTRTATIEAQTLCSMWEIDHDTVMKILEDFKDMQAKFKSLICEHVEHSVPTCLAQLPMFRDFDRNFRMLMSLYCERRVYFPGNTIAGGGQPGDGLYIINLGEAALLKRNWRIATYASGSHYGATIMLGIHRFCIGTLEAVRVCHVLVITRESYIMALRKYPAPECAEALKVQESAVADELLAAIKRHVVRQYTMSHCKDTLAQIYQDGRDHETRAAREDSELLRLVVRAWGETTRDCRFRRDRDAKHWGKVSWWIVMKQLARERRAEQEQEVVGHVWERDTPRPGSTVHLSAWDGRIRSPPRRGRAAGVPATGSLPPVFPPCPPAGKLAPLSPYCVDQAASPRRDPARAATAQYSNRSIASWRSF